MNPGVNQTTEANPSGVPAPERPTAQVSRRWLKQQVWSLPLLDARGADEILGYGEDVELVDDH